jgi:hypothetical protein
MVANNVWSERYTKTVKHNVHALATVIEASRGDLHGFITHGFVDTRDGGRATSHIILLLKDYRCQASSQSVKIVLAPKSTSFEWVTHYALHSRRHRALHSRRHRDRRRC